MFKVKIYGAGSIGNHLAHGCRSKNWDVLICDVDPAALERTKTQIYPTRYGKWDEKIRLSTVDRLDPAENFDLAILGTPPDSHIPLALDLMKQKAPRVILIEKPLCGPGISGSEELLKLSRDTGTHILVGYNHTLTPHTIAAEKLLKNGLVGEPLTMEAKFREHWEGIFTAHPWLQGPEDTYLGFSERGGGASGEHSHAINIWQHFAHAVGAGRIFEVSAMLNFVRKGRALYDNICQLHVKTEKGLVGLIVQDVITKPAQKTLRLQGNKGFIEWTVNYDKGNDSLRYSSEDQSGKEQLFSKTRPDDFKGEIDHVDKVLRDEVQHSPISLERGLDTMMVVAAAHLSHKAGKKVKIDYNKGYKLTSLVSE